MDMFLTQYGGCILLCAVGLFFVVMSYLAAKYGRSGVPFVGGFLIALGFLTTPHKWLALLALVDYGYWYIPYAVISDHFHRARLRKAVAALHLRVRTSDQPDLLYIRIPARNEEIGSQYFEGTVYQLRVPRLFYAICTDEAGSTFLLADPCKRGSGIQTIPFIQGKASLAELHPPIEIHLQHQ